MFYSNTTFYGENEYGISSRLHIIHFFGSPINAFEEHDFQGFIFTHPYIRDTR